MKNKGAQKAEMNADAARKDVEIDLEKDGDKVVGGQFAKLNLNKEVGYKVCSSDLDAKFKAQMGSEIAKLHQRKEAASIYVTHDQTEAMTLGDRIVIMKDGYTQLADVPQN